MQLSDKLELKFRLDANQKRALHKLKLFSVADLLFHFPVRYSDISTVFKISDLVAGTSATVYGKVSKLKTKKGFRSKIPMAEGEIADLSGKIKIIWFNQAYLAKMLHDGENVKLTGKVTASKNGISNSGFSYPVYAETRGITSKWFYHAIEKILREKTLDDVEDYIPSDILK